MGPGSSTSYPRTALRQRRQKSPPPARTALAQHRAAGCVPGTSRPCFRARLERLGHLPHMQTHPIPRHRRRADPCSPTQSRLAPSGRAPSPARSTWPPTPATSNRAPPLAPAASASSGPAVRTTSPANTSRPDGSERAPSCWARPARTPGRGRRSRSPAMMPGRTTPERPDGRRRAGAGRRRGCGRHDHRGR